MVMTAHSPGPWTFDGPRANIHVRQANNPDMRVCFMTSDGPTRENARLIAAAPDLLAALQEIIARNEIQHWFNLDQARAAVAKATLPTGMREP